MTRSADLRELPADELRTRLDSAKEELFNLRFQLATGQLDNPMRIKEVRHDVARILTLLRERELEELEGPETEDAAAEVGERARRRRFGRRRTEDEEPAADADEAPEEDES